MFGQLVQQKKLQLVLLGVALLGLESCDNALLRDRRSDDMPASQIVVERLSEQVVELAAKVVAVETQIQTDRKQVAFHAYHAGNLNLAAHGTLVYDTVTVNIGNGYSDHTGFFTAPVSGVYSFFLSLLADDGSGARVDIVAEDSIRAATATSRQAGDFADPTSTQTVVHLTADQRVWTRSPWENPTDVSGGMWTTFAGFLIQAD